LKFCYKGNKFIHLRTKNNSFSPKNFAKSFFEALFHDGDTDNKSSAVQDAGLFRGLKAFPRTACGKRREGAAGY
jgi:hypothetical protein